jgi:Holliday junction resolvase RusA-like endonuclease
MRGFRRAKPSFVVERRAVAPSGPRVGLTLTKLPVPPAANNLFFNAGSGGRALGPRYRAWRAAAGWEARLQRPPRVRGPVAIAITVEEGASRADLDNLAKAPIDLLCELQLIEGDHREVIREVTLRWGAVEGLSIEVRPVP